jgi:hypothetical protein
MKIASSRWQRKWSSCLRESCTSQVTYTTYKSIWSADRNRARNKEQKQRQDKSHSTKARRTQGFIPRFGQAWNACLVLVRVSHTLAWSILLRPPMCSNLSTWQIEPSNVLMVVTTLPWLLTTFLTALQQSSSAQDLDLAINNTFPLSKGL